MNLSSLGGKHRRKASGAWQFGASGSQSLSVGSKVSGCRRIRALTLCEFYLEELGQVFIVSVAGGGERGWGNALLLPRG